MTNNDVIVPIAPPVPFGGKPKYIEVSPDTCHLQPFLCKDVQMYGFFLEADKASLQVLVDQRLNTPREGGMGLGELLYTVCVSPLTNTPLVLLTFALVSAGSSTLPPDSQMGYIPEYSCTFWLLLNQTSVEPPHYKPQTVFKCFAPFIVVDNCFSLCAGREIYGFPKQRGTFSPWPAPVNGAINPAPGSLSVKADALLLYDPAVEAVPWNLVEIKRLTGPTNTGAPVRPEDILRIWGGLDKKDIRPGVDLVFLKQFRDLEDGSRACYQAITEATMSLSSSPAPSGWFLSDSYSIAVPELASHPWVSLMGFKPLMQSQPGLLGAPVPVTPAPLLGELGGFGFYATSTFTSGNGRVIWRAGS